VLHDASPYFHIIHLNSCGTDQDGKCHSVIDNRIGQELNENADAILEQRSFKPPTGRTGTLKTIGTVSGGLDTARMAFSSLEHVFHSGCKNYAELIPGSQKPKVELESLQRVAMTVLKDHPVDLLIIDGCQLEPGCDLRWRQWAAKCPLPKRPRVIAESWPSDTTLFHNTTWGPLSGVQRRQWEELHYSTRCSRLAATDYNGCVDQSRMIVLRILNYDTMNEMKVTWPKKSTMPARPMGNLLRPVGIPWASYRRDLEGLNQTTVIRHIPDSRQDPMPCRVGDLIRTPKGVRPLFSDEIAKGLGIPKNHLNEKRHPNASQISNSTCLNIWEAVGRQMPFA